MFKMIIGNLYTSIDVEST